ncbi:hypothetical protein Tco_1227640 [Tanacetum coccineum]
MTRPSSNHLNDYYWDELKETDGEKDLEAHYTNAKPLGKAFPQKEKDTESFTLPCFINNMCFNKALADLGTSVFVPTIEEGEGMDEPIIEDIETKFDNIGYNEDECEYLGFYNFCHS